MEKRISGHTGLMALFGSPVGHSGSPAMYNFSFQHDGLDRAARSELREALEDLWSTGRGERREPLGTVNADRLQPEGDGLSALTGYLLKYPKRKKRWRQSRGLQKPVYRRPNDSRWTRRKLELACTADTEDAYVWEQRYPGWRFLGAYPQWNEERGEWRCYIRLWRKDLVLLALMSVEPS